MIKLNEFEIATWWLRYHGVEKENIDSFQVIGYSLGARMAMYLAKLFPHRLEGLYLFAPDGFKKMPMQNFIEHYKIGIYLFQGFVKRPKSFHYLVKTLRKIKFISQRLHDFVLRKTETIEQRKQLFGSWQTYKQFHLSAFEINKVLANLPNVHLVFGKNDGVIPVSNLKTYDVKDEQLLLLNKGHDLFDAAALKALRLRLNF